MSHEIRRIAFISLTLYLSSVLLRVDLSVSDSLPVVLANADQNAASDVSKMAWVTTVLTTELSWEWSMASGYKHTYVQHGETAVRWIR